MRRKNPDIITLDYGKSGLELRLDKNIADWIVLEPELPPELVDFGSSFRDSLKNPIASKPLKSIITRDDNVAIVTSDGTRPVPNKLLIPSIINYLNLSHGNVTVIIGTGTHRPHTEEEIVNLLGGEITRNCHIVNHDATDTANLAYLGDTESGIPVEFSRHYLQVDKRIAIGFIEPHFFAGYSGGAKAICPGICGMPTIDAFHSFEIIGHPNSDYGLLEENPQQLVAREVASLAPPDFLINVILNSSKQITHIFSGDYIEAHRAGCYHAGKMALVPVERKYPIVVTTNSGYPLDQNLYQTVKGICAAARIVEGGGTIFVASECSRGIPDDGKFADMLGTTESNEELLEKLSDPDFRILDRWQVQKLVMVLKRAEVKIFTSLSNDAVKRCRMTKVDYLEQAVYLKAKEYDKKPAVAVLPRGPLTIPTIE